MDGLSRTSSGLLPSVDPASAWQIEQAADLDGDGKADLVWRNTSTGQNAVWFMDGLTRTSSGLMPPVGPASGWQIEQAADLDGDGKADLVWRNTTTGQNAVWFMDGLTRTDSGLIPSVSPSTGWEIRP
jgi:hypothetical protein